MNFREYLMDNDANVFEALMLAFYESIGRYYALDEKARKRRIKGTRNIAGYPTVIKIEPNLDSDIDCDVSFDSNIRGVSFSLAGKMTDFDFWNNHFYLSWRFSEGWKRFGKYSYWYIEDNRILRLDTYNHDRFYEAFEVGGWAKADYISAYGEDDFNRYLTEDRELVRWWETLKEGTALKALEVL